MKIEQQYKMSSEKPSVANPLEQYVLLAKSAKGSAAVDLVKRVLEAPGVYVFGELLDLPNIQELQNGQYAQYWELLNLFAYGTYSDYLANTSSYPPLTNAKITKLKHLTIVSLAAKSKYIAYADLLKELHLKDMRELEDLIIEVIYADVICGKLDQMNQRLEVDYAIGRDIRAEQLTTIINTLQEWCDTCYTVLLNTEQQIVETNKSRSRKLMEKAQMEQEIATLKKNVKTIAANGEEMAGISEGHVSSGDKGGKKHKTKGLRGSSKISSYLWNK